MNSCSICAVAESAKTVNELLHAGKLTLQQIAHATGFSKSACHRHSRGTCVNGYMAFKAALIKSKGKKTDSGRLIVQWPDADSPANVAGKSIFFGYDLPIPQDELKPNDVLFVVTYQQTPLAAYKNPSGLICDALVDAALAEDLEREVNT